MNLPKTCSQSIKVNFPHRIFLGSEYIITLPKSGDMITSVRLVLDLPSVNVLAEQIINKAEFLVRDNILESISGDFLQILNDYGTNIEKRQAYQNNLNGPLVTLDIPFSIVKSGFHMVNVPSIRISLGQGITQAEISGYLLIDYSLIEDQTKTTFVQRVIQNQNIRGVFTGATLVKFDTALVGPVYHLFFSAKVAGNYVDYIKNVKLVTDGQERFNLGKQYLKYVEPLKIFKSIASEPVLFYSFCVEGGGVPSGSMNFSRIDTQRFEIELLPNTDEVQIDIWAQSHNFMYFNSSNVSPIFDTHESLLTSTQDQYLSALQDLPVTVSYRFYLNSVSIFYHTNEDIPITPQLVSSFPTLTIPPEYSPGLITINNVQNNTYLVFSFSSQGYNTVQGSFTIKYINANPINFTEGGQDYSEVTDIDIKVDQYPIITMNTGCHPLAGRYVSSMIYDHEDGSFVLLTDSYSIRKQISETALAIDYGDNFYVAATVNRTIYKKDRSIFSSDINGGCIIKYDSDYNTLWAHQLGGNYPSIDYLYPRFYVSSSVPVLGNGDSNIKRVVCSWDVTMLVDSYNNLLMGGSNNKGQCGNGPILTKDIPGFFIPIGCPGISETQNSFATGESHTAIVDSDGTIWVTGDNTSGQIGLGVITGVNEFTQVSTPGTVFVSVSCGANFTVALDSDGTIWVTGDNTSGQIGLGATSGVTTFTQVTIPGITVESISAGYNFTAALDSDGTIWVTGDNTSGQIGLGATSGVTTFTQVTIPGITVESISSGYNFTVALDSDGTVWVTGDNTSGQIGLGATSGVTTFTQVTIPGITVESISAGSYNNTCLVDSDGDLWVTGNNSNAQLGLAPQYDIYSISEFTKITSVFDPIGLADPSPISPPKFVSASFGDYHLIAVDTSGNFWVAGRNALSGACIGTSQPSHLLLFNKISQQYRGLPNTIELQIINTDGMTLALNQITADKIKSKNIVVDANGKSYIDVLYSSNSPTSKLPTTGGVLKAAVIKVDENLDFMECLTYGNVNCKTIVDRQNVKYTTYIDLSGNLVLEFLTNKVIVSGIQSTTNFYTEIDFLGNIYLCGTYSSSSTVTPSPTFSLPWTSDTYGGTFIMKLNGTVPEWIIRIKNSDSTSNNIISRILANSYTGIIYVTGYLACVQNNSQYIYDGFGTQSSFGPILEWNANREGINGFMFSFDPSGYVVPIKTTIPPIDFFSVEFQMLIGTHPIYTIAVPQFFPPLYFQYPPVSLDPYSCNKSKVLYDNPYNANVSGSGWGNGTYSILASSFNSGKYYPTRAFNLTKGENPWITNGENYPLPDGYSITPYITFNDPPGSINGDYIALTLPAPVKMDYISFTESPDLVYSEPSSLFTIIGTNELVSTWWGGLYLGSDTSILYTKTQELVSPDITSQVTSNSIQVESVDNLYQGMTIDGTDISITNISEDNIISLSAEYNGDSVSFIDSKNKVVRLNTTKPYLTYILCAQKTLIHSNGGTWRVAYLVYNSTTALP